MRFFLVAFLAVSALALAPASAAESGDVKSIIGLNLNESEGKEIRDKIRKHLDELLEKLKDAIEHGKGIRDDYKEKLKELRQKLKDMKEDIGVKAKELLEKIKEKAKEYLKKVLERLGLD